MGFFRRSASPQRRPVREEAFRSADLRGELKTALAPWLKDEGFTRLGSQGWKRRNGDHYFLVVVQCSQDGWTPDSGNRFVVELEQAVEPRWASGFKRDRIWNLLDTEARQETLTVNNHVAVTLPGPDPTMLSLLDDDTRAWYLAQFEESPNSVDSSDVWFRYYDETDAATWAGFLARNLPASVDDFLSRPSRRA